MKSVLISVQPKWCELIANSIKTVEYENIKKKTIEVRKTKPKINVPFKVYIYCTKPSKSHQTICGHMALNSDELYRHPTQGIKYGDSIELMLCDDYSKDNFLNGKVIGEFVCDDIDTISVHNETLYCENNSQANKLQQMCLPVEEIKKYLGQKNLGYNWHISDLVIYDKPKELSEFYRVDKSIICGAEMCEICNHYNYMRVNADEFDYDCDCDRLLENKIPITRPPQSWCYCEEVSI